MEKRKNNVRRIPILVMLVFALCVTTVMMLGFPVAASTTADDNSVAADAAVSIDLSTLHSGTENTTGTGWSYANGTLTLEEGYIFTLTGTGPSTIINYGTLSADCDVKEATITNYGTVLGGSYSMTNSNTGAFSNTKLMQSGVALYTGVINGGTFDFPGGIANHGVITVTSGNTMTVLNSKNTDASPYYAPLSNQSGGSIAVQQGGRLELDDNITVKLYSDMEVSGTLTNAGESVGAAYGSIETFVGITPKLVINDGGSVSRVLINCEIDLKDGGSLSNCEYGDNAFIPVYETELGDITFDYPVKFLNNVTITEGSTFHQNVIIPDGVTVIISGDCTFENGIKSATASLAEILSEGYAFHDAEGNGIALTEGQTELTGTFTVALCQNHAYVDGTCSFCKYICTHNNINTQTGVCEVCNKQWALGVISGMEIEFFNSLSEAFAKAEEMSTQFNAESTVKLLANFTMNSSATLNGGAVILDLNGFTLDCGSYYITNNATLELRGENDGEITGINRYVIENRGSFMLTSGTVSNTNSSASDTSVAVYNNGSDSESIINGGTVNGAYDGIYNKSGSLTINGGAVIATSTAIDISKGILTVNDGEIQGSKGICNDGGTVNMTGGTITASTGIEHYAVHGSVTLSGGLLDCSCAIKVWDGGTVADCLAPGYIYYVASTGEVFTITEGQSEIGLVSVKIAPCQNHTGGTATCTTLAVCELCKLEYGTYYHADDDQNGFCDVCGKLPITEATFPDANFRTYISDNFDTDKDGLLSTEEISAVTEIKADGKSIESLSGVEYLTNLQYLYVFNNNLTTLDVSQNEELTILQCGQNQLTALDVSQNTELVELSCYENLFTSLDVSDNEKLETLECSDCPNLASLTVNTTIIEIRAGNTALRSLDLSACSQLDYFNYNDTNLTSLELPAHFLLDGSYGHLAYRSAISIDIDQKTMVLDLRDYVADVSRIFAVSSNATLVGNYLYISEGATQVYYCYDTGAAEGSYPLTVSININNPHSHSFDENGYCADCGLQAIIRVDVAFNNKYFTTTSFADALALAENGTEAEPATIKLYTDITVAEAVAMTGGYATLDLNGHKLTFTATNDTPFTLIAGTFTIRDSSTAQTGTIYHDVRGNEERTVIALTDSTALVLESGTLDFSAVTAAIAVEDGSIMQQRGGKITTPILLNNGRYELDDGTIETTYPYAFIIDSDGSAWYYIEITGGTVSVKDTLGDGGLLNFPQNGCTETVTITGGTFKNTSGNPFKICVYHSDAQLLIAGGTFEQGLVYTSLWGDDTITLASVLESGYAFYDANGNLVVLADGQTEITEKVTVGVCTHIDSNTDHICEACGETLSQCADENNDHKCDVCGIALSECTGGTSTCVDKAICTVCGQPYGELTPDAHTEINPSLVPNGVLHHNVVWSCCDAVVTENVTCIASNADGSCSTAETCVCGNLLIAAKDNHKLTYTASGNVITETCGWTRCEHTATATLHAPENPVYNGTQKLATVTYSDDWKGDDLMVGYSGTANDGSSYAGIVYPAVKAGTVTASITAQSEDYTVATASVTYTIQKAPVTVGIVSVESPEAIYPHTALGSIVLTRTNTTIPGTLALNADQTLTVGTQEYNWTWTPDDANNYKETKGTITITVTKATPTADIFDFTPPTNLNACDGLAKEATVTVKEAIEGVGSVTVKYFKDGVELDGAPTTVGTYTVKIEVAEGANFFKSEELLTDEAWTFTFDITDEATHTGLTLKSNENGTHDKYCTVCQKVFADDASCVYEETVNDAYVASPATCISGTTYYKSCECGHKSVETFVYGDTDPDNHDWNDTDVCSRCNAVKISEKTFPDANFRAYLAAYNSFYYYSYATDGVFTQDEIVMIKEMSEMVGYGITDLTGIEYFTELTTLNCHGNWLKSVDLSKNTKLTDVQLGHQAWVITIAPDATFDFNTLGIDVSKLTIPADWTMENGVIKFNKEGYAAGEIQIEATYPSGYQDVLFDIDIIVENPHTHASVETFDDCSKQEVCLCGDVTKAATEHDFSGNYLSDADGHWHKCENCAVTDTKEEHSGTDDGNCKTSVTCSCDHVITEAKDDHSFDNACDTDCNNTGCNYTRTTSHVAEADDGDCSTAILCEHCDEEMTAAKTHSFDNNCDTTCNNGGCNHTRTAPHTPEADDGNCMTEVKCSVCQTVTTPASGAHTGGTATCQAQANCSVCGTAYGELGSHSFTVAQNDKNQHWNKCATCDETDTKADHTDSDSNHECDICDAWLSPFEKVSLSLGDDLAVNYFIAKGNFTNPQIRFTINGYTKTVDGVLVDEQFKFVFDGVAPQWIGDTITAELIIGGEVVEVKEYSVLKYLNSLKAKTAAELGISDAKYATMQTLIADLLVYGGAAQNYTGHNTGALVSNGITGSTFKEIGSTDASKDSGTYVTFTGATVFFDSVNTLRFKFESDDLTGVVFKIKVNNGSEETVEYVNNGDGTYTITTAAIFADRFDDVYTVTAYKGDVADATLTYSVKSYVYSKQDGTDNIAALAKATYNYGISAKAYKDAE